MTDRIRKHSGQFVTETLGFDGGRNVTVFVPPAPPDAVVYMGDGQRIPEWGRSLQSFGAPTTMLVGVHRVADESGRLHEYSLGFDRERFEAHERFFVETVPRWANSRFGMTMSTERTAVFGVSAAGELALALGHRHPGVYGAILCASPGGGYKPGSLVRTPAPRTYLVAGTGEPFFLDNARRWAVALSNSGVEVVMRERAGTHGGAFWQEEFPLMIKWAFGPRPED